MHFNSPFSPLALLSLHIYLPIALHAIHVKYTQTKNDVIYLQFFDDTYLALTYIVVLSNPNPHELGTTNEVRPAFYVKWKQHYDFDVKVGRYGFVDFVHYVIDYGCLRCVFCFRIKEMEKDIFYINFYSIIFLQNCFVLFICFVLFCFVLCYFLFFYLSRKEVWRCLLIVVDKRSYIHIMQVHNTYIHHILNYIIKVKSYLSYKKSGYTNINH